MTSEHDEDGGQPRGREEIRVAVIEAANDLFGEKGPDAVSIRDVAKRARVNHGLVHRHFGTKEQLLREVMRNYANAFMRQAEDVPSVDVATRKMLQVMTEQPSFVRIVAHLLLSGHEAEEFVAESGGLALLAQLTQKEAGLSAKEGQLLSAASTAMCMGWVLFESFLLAGAGFEGDIDEARNYIRELADDLWAQKLRTGKNDVPA